MEQIIAWLTRFLNGWKFWIVIAPWEAGVLIRLGRNARTLMPGPHWRIPLLDRVILVSTRLRFVTIPPVTIGNGDNKARMISAVVSYRIDDPETAMMRYSNPEAALMLLAQSEIAKGNKPDDCEKAMRLNLFETGVSIESIRFVEDVTTKTYRLLQGGIWSVPGEKQTIQGPIEFY